MSDVNQKLLDACEAAQRACGQTTDVGELSEILADAISDANAQAKADAEPLSSELLLSRGWERVAYHGVKWPSIRTPAGAFLQWHADSLWIDDAPIMLAKTWGDIRRVLEAFKVTKEGGAK